MANVFVLRTPKVGDTKIKSGVAAIELHNGDFVAIGAKKADNTYTLTAPAGTPGEMIGVVYNADVVTEGVHRGLVDDPRLLVHKAGTGVDVYFPEKGQEIAITEVVAGTPTVGEFLVPKTGSTGYEAKATAGTGIAYKVTGEKFISIGNERVKTYEAICVQA